jgi:adenosylhomocysteine nucleosidase
VNRIAVIFALEREAAPFRRRVRQDTPADIHISGIGQVRARRTTEQVLKESTPRLVIAAGFCGALIATLKVGDIVRSPRIVTVDRLICDPAEKRRLAETHDADAVDMESAAIEELCSARGIPFQAIRAVSDTTDATLSAELVRLLSGGDASVWQACWALVKKPSLLPEFLRLARDTKLASRNLAEVLMKVTEVECA